MLIFFIVLAVLALIIIFIFNSLVARKNDVANAFASIDAMLKKRFDLIPNLVATIKESTKFETSTLEKVIAMRSQMGGMNANQMAQLDRDTSSALKGLMVQVEAYPDLKSSQNFVQLQNALQEVEDQLAAARRSYNAAVTIYNNALEMFPSNIVAGILHYSKHDLLSTPEEERKNINVGNLFK
jgi:LemA protein